MARPRKTGLEYFPLDVTAGIDDEIELLEAKFGLEGFAIYIKLLQSIYKNGYYINWTEKEQLLFIKRVNVTENIVNNTIDACLQWKLFNKRLFEEFNILTSHGIQQRFLFAIGRRKGVDIEKSYLLLSKKEINESKVQINLIDTLVKEDVENEHEELCQELEEYDQQLNEDFKIVASAYQENIGLLSSTVMQEINNYLESKVEADLIVEAIKIACMKNVRNMSYVKGILEKLITKGIYTLEAYKASKVEANNNSNESRYGDDDLPC